MEHTETATEPTTLLYFEAHVTVEPCFGPKLEAFRAFCKPHGFRVAKLLMKKRDRDTPERSQYDSFCTGQSKNYGDLYARMIHVVQACQGADIKVWRYKIENTLLDVRLK